MKVCSNGGATYIIGEMIAKDKFESRWSCMFFTLVVLNIENFMQSFENLLLQKYSTKFLNIAHK